MEKSLESIKILIIIELVFSVKCARVSVLHTNHPTHGDDGKYFLFDADDFSKMVGETDWNGNEYEVIQGGSKNWLGKVQVWDRTTLEKGAFAGGRRVAGFAAGDWAKGDTIQIKACTKAGIRQINIQYFLECSQTHI